MQSTSSTNIERSRFTAIAASLARRYDADLFLTVSGYSDSGKSYIGIDPTSELIVDETTGKSDIDAFVFADYRPVFGFLSYEFGMKLRGIVSAKHSSFPLGHMRKYTTLVEYDQNENYLSIHSNDSRLEHDIQTLTNEARLSDGDFGLPIDSPGQVNLSIDRDGYIDRVRRTLEYIRQGYTYQLNLTTRFSVAMDDLDVLSFFIHLYQAYPAPFYALFRSGKYAIVSTSPERFLRVENGDVLSQPVKGTLRFDEYNDSLLRDLTESSKESAELSMIVDLIRNDISLNCEYGSVRVEGHKSTFVVDNLIQMYSNVLGRLRSDRTCIDLLLDALPGGSVTGCPKKKSMEIIDELEPHTRDAYCGSFFVIRDRWNMDSSISIRTGYYDTVSSEFHFYAGSGIVVDSITEREYLETVAKAEKFLKVLAL